MPGYDEIVAALSGSWQLMQGRADAIRRFDLSADGFWNSFFAIVVALPALFVMWTDEANELVPGADNVAGRISVVLRLALIEAVAWVLPLIAIAYALHAMGRRDRVMPFIIANNWGQALIIWIIVPVLMVHSFMPAVADVAVMLMLLFFIASLVLFWRLNNAVLGMGPVVPAVVIVAMLFLSLAIDYVLRVVLMIPTLAD